MHNVETNSLDAGSARLKSFDARLPGVPISARRQALLVGIAMQDGLISSLDQTLGNPLNMTSGLTSGERRIALNQFISTQLIEAVETTTQRIE